MDYQKQQDSLIRSQYSPDSDISPKKYKGNINTEVDDTSMSYSQIHTPSQFNLQLKRKFQVNWTFLTMFNIILNLCEILIGYVISCTNQLTITFNAKFDFVNENQALYQGLIGSSGIFGMTMGALIGGRLMQNGRKNLFVATSIIGIVGCIISMFENIPCILIGRAIFGFACGVQSVCIPRYIEETVPSHANQMFSPLSVMCQTLGGLLSMFMGEGLPNDKDTEALKASQFWRFIMGFPIILYLIALGGVVLYIQYESPQFLMFNGKRDEAKLMLAKIYDKSENPEEILQFLEHNTKKETSFITLNEAMGLSNPRNGTYFIGVSSMIGALIAVLILNKVGRRTLLMYGHVIMALCHFLIGLFAYLNYSQWVVGWMVSFILAYYITNGPVIWLYVSEVVVDTALGLCIFTLWGTVLVLSLTTNFLMESALRPCGVFWLFAVISVFGAIFCFIFIKETRGLNDKDKKMLYSPVREHRQSISMIQGQSQIINSKISIETEELN
eukprot:403350492